MGKPSISRHCETEGVREGLREKLERAGLTAMSDEELLAIVLGSGMARASAVVLAGVLLAQASGVHGLTRMTRDEIRQTRGIGDAQAARVQAAIELGRRTLARRPETQIGKMLSDVLSLSQPPTSSLVGAQALRLNAVLAAKLWFP